VPEGATDTESDSDAITPQNLRSATTARS
jgi:hypothetical protein